MTNQHPWHKQPIPEQPPPKKGKRAVYPVAKMLLEGRLEQRYEKGLKTYGTPLETFNGRDPLEDLLDELLDGMMYLTQAILERKAPPG